MTSADSSAPLSGSPSVVVVAIARDSLRLKKLAAGHFLDNPASGRVLEKLGFEPLGITAPRLSCARRNE